MNQKNKRLCYRLGRRFFSLLLIFTLIAPDMMPMVSYASEYINNQPRYVSFERPEKLSIDDLGLASDSNAAKDTPQEETKPSSGSGSGNSKDTTEVKMATPSDADLREPEQFYDLDSLIDEPDGILVQFNERYRTYEIGDHEYTTIIGGYSGLYKDEDGRVRSVDNDLVETDSLDHEDEADYATGSNATRLRTRAMTAASLRNGAGAVDIQIPEKMTSLRGYTMTSGEDTIEVIPAGGNFKKSLASGNAIRYSDVFDKIDYQYTVLGNTMKEDIILLEKQDRYEFSYYLKSSTLKFRKVGNTVAAYKTSAASPVFSFSAPYMQDADGHTSRGITLSFDRETGKVTLKADKKWLEDEERVYPVRIDPDMSLMSSQDFHFAMVADRSDRQDVYIGDTQMMAGYSKEYGNCRLLIDLSPDWEKVIERDNEINNDPNRPVEPGMERVIFKAGVKTNDAINRSVFSLFAPQKDWSVSNITWNRMKGNGIDSGLQEICTAQYSQGQDTYMTFDITDTYNGWIAKDSQTRHGLMLRTQVEGPDGAVDDVMWAETFSRGNDPTVPPRLEVSWYGDIAEGDPSDLDMEDFTMEVDPGLIATEAGSKTMAGIAIHGKCQTGADIEYSISRSSVKGNADAKEEWIYPDFSEIDPDCEPAVIQASNWQAAALYPDELKTNVIYTAKAKATGYPMVTDPDTGEEVPSEDSVTVEADPVEFLLYKVQVTDLISRIAKHYGTTVERIREDNQLEEQLTEAGTVLFIRDPSTSKPYTFEIPSDKMERFLLESLLHGKDPRCESHGEPVNMSTGSFYMSQTDISLPELDGNFDITRSYGSTTPYFRSEFGMGWNSLVGEKIMVLEDGTIIFVREDGKAMIFEKSGDNEYKAPDGYDYTLEAVDSIELVTAGETASPSDAEKAETESTELEEKAVRRTLSLTADNTATDDTGSNGAATDADGTDDGIDPVLPSIGWKITQPDGTEKIFNAYGLLVTEKNRRNHVTSYVYDDDFRLHEIITPTEKSFIIEQDEEGKILSITQPDGGLFTYSYDEEDNLISVTDPAGTDRRYEYDAEHHMTAWYDENGTRVILNVYDDLGRVTEQTDALGSVMYFDYQEGATTVTDNRGIKIRYELDSQKRNVRTVYGNGETASTTYSADNRIESKTDENGATTTYTYDDNGNILTETRGDGAISSSTYNDLNLPVTLTDYEGNTTSFVYDEQGNLLSMTDAEGNTTSYSYDELSRMVAVTDGNGGTSTFTYDGAVPVGYTDGEGNTHTFTYDEMNRQLTAADPLGNTSTFTYDERGRRISETAKDGGTTSYEFDPAGCVISMTDAMGVKTDFTYDRMYNILSGTDALGNTLTYEYDGNYNKVKETDAKGNVTLYTYDSRDRLIQVTDALGNSIKYALDGKGNTTATTDRLGNTVKAGYHKILGVPVSIEDALGNVTYYRYDKNGNVKRIIYPDGSEASYTYDRAGRIIATTAQNGLVTAMSYDRNGNIIRITDDETRVYTFEYDHNNRLVKTTDPLGGVTEYTYDAAGNQTGLTDGNGHSSGYAYDAAGRLKEVTDALGQTTGSDYDLNGRTLKTTDALGNSNTYHYDVLGQMLAVTDAAGSVTAMEYDPLGNVLKMTDALKGETVMEYDALSRTVKMTDAMGGNYIYEYDAEGNVTGITMPDGDTVAMEYDANGQMISSTDEAGVKTTYEYDSMGRIVKASDNAGNTMAYEYDPAGNLVRQTDTIGRDAVYEYDKFNRLVRTTGTDGATTQYEYDVLDRLIKVTEADGTTTAYEYDKVGNLIRTTEPGEAVYTYAYDAINRITGKVDPLGAATNFAYDANGNLTEATDGNGVKTAYTYDVLNRMTALQDGNGNTTGYEYDELSRLLSVTTPEGNKQEYRYDALSRMTKAKDANGLITEYQYDVMGNLVKEISPKGAKTSYTYDKHDELTSITDAMGNVTAYEVDLNRMVTKMTQKNGGEYTYAYDAVHRLTGITTPLGLNRSFTYDAADNITKDTDNLGRTTTFEYDIMHRLTKAVNAKGGVETYEYDIRGNINAVTNAMGHKNTYVYDLIDQMKESVDPEGKATKFTYDLVGNLMSVTRPGERTTSYAYDNNYNATAMTDPKGYIYQNTYDKDNRQITAVDPLNQTQTIAYDAGSRITALTDKMGLSQEFTYDAHGNVTAAKATNGLITHYKYDILDRLTMVTDPMGNDTTYAYDVMGNITAMTNAQKNVTNYTYDLEGNMTSLTSPMGRKEQFSYDAGGRMTEKLTAKGDTIRYDYDVLNGLAEKTYEDHNGAEADHPVQMGYNAMGQRISMEDITGESTYTYDALGRLKTATNGSGKTVEYYYDEADNLSVILYPDGYEVQYTYDKNDNITKIRDRDGRETFYSYDPLNRLTKVKRADGSTSSYTYNARDQIVEAENLCSCGFLISDYQYKYDDAGLIVSEIAKECLFASNKDYGHKGGPDGECVHVSDNPWQNQNPQWQTTKRSFTYDNNGQLIECQEDKGMFDKTTYTYEYDNVGNRTLAKKYEIFAYRTDKAMYDYNADNQMVSAVVCEGNLTKRYTFKYDANGNMTQECLMNRAEVTYQYDTENRLKAVNDRQKLLMAAAYDGDGNRTFQLNYNPEAECGYGKNVSGEVFMPENSKNEDGSLTAEGDLFSYICSATGRAYDLTEYVNDTNRQYTEVLTAYTVNSGAMENYSYNGRQRLSRNNIWNEARGVDHNETSYYLYDGRGSVTANTWQNGMVTSVYQYDPYGQVTLGSTEHTDFYGYNAESYNPNTGLEYLRARYYNADKGRFFQEDTYLGDVTDPLTLNRYAYVKNSPLNYVDPSGHWYEFGRSVDSRQETAGSFTGTTVSASGYSQQKNTGKAGGSFRENAKELIDGLKALMEKVVHRKSISECREEAEEKGRPFIPNMLEQQKDGIVGIAYALVRNLGFGTAEILTWLAGRNDLKDYLKDKKGDLESWLLENYVYDPVYFHFGELIGDALGIYYSAKGVEKVLKEAKSVVSMLGSFLSKIGTGGSISMSGDAAVLSGKAGLELEIILELLGEAGVALAGVIKEVAVGIVAASGIPGDGEKFLHELRNSLERESETKNPQDYLDEALERQGLEKTPKKLKEKWTDGEYNYEVRVHEGNGKYTDADSIYRVSRQKVPDPNPKVQGSGKEYLGSDGKWYHESELIEFNKNGTPNPSYNEHGAKVTHIPVD